jgi:hypothetical protein
MVQLSRVDSTYITESNPAKFVNTKLNSKSLAVAGAALEKVAEKVCVFESSIPVADAEY